MRTPLFFHEALGALVSASFGSKFMSLAVGGESFMVTYELGLPRGLSNFAIPSLSKLVIESINSQERVFYVRALDNKGVYEISLFHPYPQHLTSLWIVEDFL